MAEPEHDPKRPASIDLSLELERQLDDEDEPTSPRLSSSDRPPSLDPSVLASIVTQLRMNLNEATKERDELASIVAGAHGREAELKDALQYANEKCTQLEAELAEANQKIKDDEDNIKMLRSKVDESRRGLMRLQSERRQSSSTMALDMSRAGLPAFTSPASSKRMSFTPLTGSGVSIQRMHNRQSSISDSNVPLGDPNSDPFETISLHPSSPTASSFSGVVPRSPSPPKNNGLPPPSSTRRFSNLFNKTSPPQVPAQLADTTAIDLQAELEALKRELRVTKEQLDETRAELAESNEAREASESCVTTLRDFIAEHNVGVRELESTIPPPPVPAQEHKRAQSSGWGFNKLWKSDPSPSATSPQATTGPSASNQLSEPLSKKIGGFFSSATSSRASVSSVASSSDIHQTEPITVTATPRRAESDGSSVEDEAEPRSPSTKADDSHILVRDDGASARSAEIVAPANEVSIKFTSQEEETVPLTPTPAATAV